MKLMESLMHIYLQSKHNLLLVAQDESLSTYLNLMTSYIHDPSMYWSRNCTLNLRSHLVWSCNYKFTRNNFTRKSKSYKWYTTFTFGTLQVYDHELEANEQTHLREQVQLNFIFQIFCINKSIHIHHQQKQYLTSH